MYTRGLSNEDLPWTLRTGAEVAFRLGRLAVEGRATFGDGSFMDAWEEYMVIARLTMPSIRPMSGGEALRMKGCMNISILVIWGSAVLRLSRERGKLRSSRNLRLSCDCIVVKDIPSRSTDTARIPYTNMLFASVHRRREDY